MPPKTGKPGKPKAKAAAEEYKYDITPHLIPESQLIDSKLIKLDVDMQFGQIRTVDVAHAMSLVRDLNDNPPLELNLTVWQDPGLKIVIITVSRHSFLQVPCSTLSWMGPTNSGLCRRSGRMPSKLECHLPNGQTGADVLW
jgi:hypothetical protein